MQAVMMPRCIIILSDTDYVNSNQKCRIQEKKTLYSANTWFHAESGVRDRWQSGSVSRCDLW